MRLPRIFNRLTALSIVLALYCVPGLAAESNNRQSVKTHPAFKYSETSTDPIIEYNLLHDMLAEPDPEPLLRIYGDGRVHVHYPAYMKKAGDYELQMSKPELDSLIRELANDGIIDFDKGKAIEQKKQLKAEQRTSRGIIYHISDDTTTVIDIRLDEYQKTGSSKRVTNMNKRFAWKNLEHDTQHYPEIDEIRNAAAGTEKVRKLMTHPGLKKAGTKGNSRIQ